MSANGEPLETGVVPSELTAQKLFGNTLTSPSNDVNNNNKFSKAKDSWSKLVLGKTPYINLILNSNILIRLFNLFLILFKIDVFKVSNGGKNKVSIS